jgi:hypothetical protein
MAIKFSTNIPQTLSFPYGDSKEVEGNYGPQHMYTVEINGEKDKLYATPVLHDRIQEAGVGPGAVLTITKIELEGNKSGWSVTTDSPSTGSPSVSPNANTAAPPMQGVPTGIPRGPRPATGDFPSMVYLLQSCMRAVEEIAPNTYGPAERQASAISLFIGCQQRNVSAPEPTAETVPTNPAEDPDELPF